MACSTMEVVTGTCAVIDKNQHICQSMPGPAGGLQWSREASASRFPRELTKFLVFESVEANGVQTDTSEKVLPEHGKHVSQ